MVRMSVGIASSTVAASAKTFATACSMARRCVDRMRSLMSSMTRMKYIGLPAPSRATETVRLVHNTLPSLRR